MRRLLGVPVAAVMLTACVTINVYFPAAEAKEAAKEFVEKVIGDEAQPKEPVKENKPGGQSASLDRGIDWLSLVGIGTAYAQEQPDITIKTPAIQAIQSRMASRFDSQLREHFDSGALGFANDGTISVRDANKIPLPQRVAVNQAVSDQGRDAKAVYREIAVANNHPEWEQQIRAVFARQWIDSARPGWWVQDSGGGWRQK
ncbi:YdbL family protein [Lysobacter niastensis]|uniref:YdbL family protein n=1 Tax=Lysobacter niastensis TaxID=380629 RepID=A0ABS0B5X6_9GAMM|nr:YdbL family protein [Lysobacter niastensis]MBF6023568.1 YdbL family protein [Lysobacter niastensis]